MADVLTKIVPRESIDGSTFHVPKDGSAGCRILPNGTRITINATPTTSANSKSPNNSNRKQRYLQYKHALGKDKHILVSHAVYLAWVGAIPDGYVIDHLNGVTADNRAENLQAITPQENRKRAKLLRAMRRVGTDPTTISPERLKKIFATYTFVSPEQLIEREMNSTND